VVQEAKRVIRQRILKLLRNQEEESKHKKSLVILNKLFSIPEFQGAKTILFYASFAGEVDTFEMIQQALEIGKQIALPIVKEKERNIIPALINNLEKDLECGKYGIKQPKEDAKFVDLDKIDMVVVPGVAFDKQNNRLGRGEGYYDRFLKKLSPNSYSVGLAFDFQVVDSLPVSETDIAVSRVIVS
jgi:5-formyltetrahydrofolate cyclo-ligase